MTRSPCREFGGAATADAAPSSIRRNTLINLAGGVVPLLLLLVTVPLYLGIVGEARYGVLVIVSVLLGYFGAFDLGLGRATANQIAKLDGDRAADRATVVWTALLLNLAFAGAAALLFLLAGDLLIGTAFKIPSDLRSEALAALPWVAAAVPLATTSSVLRGALEGRERFVAANAVGMLGVALFQLIPLAIAYVRGPNLTWLIAGATIASLVTTLVSFASCWEYVRLATSFRFDRGRARMLWRYGGWVTVSGAVGPLLAGLDRLVIAATLGARAVTQYSVPFALVARIEILPSSVARALFPRFSTLPGDEAAALGRRALLGLAAVATPAVVLAVVLVQPFLAVWVGPALADPAAPLGAILLLGLWVNGLAYVPFALLQAQGRPDVPAKLHVLELPPYLLALWLGLSLFGVEGAAWAWTARAGADAALLFWASRVSFKNLLPLAPAAGAVLLACVGALTIFAEPLLRGSAGAALVVFALVWALRAAPPELRPQFRRPLGRTAVGSST